MHVRGGVLGGQKKISGLLELELQTVVNHQMQFWEADPGPLQETGCVLGLLNHLPNLLMFNYQISMNNEASVLGG